MGIEIERKYLVDHEKWRIAVKPEGTHFRQGYIVNDNDRTIRIRITDKQGYLTIKGATAGIARKEFEYEIPIEEGIELLNSFALSEIEKIRYRIIFEGKLWEVDEFLGDNSGLLTAEIELTHENEAFKLPDWILTEVSEEVKYYNSNLSINPFKNWDK